MKKTIVLRDILLISNPLGIIMQGIGVVTLMPMLVALVYGESHLIVFLGFGLLSIAVGFILRRIPVDDSKIGLKHGMMIAALAWLWAALIGGLCLMYSTNIDFLNAYFESMSAWSGTGITIYPDVEILPKSVLFLRSIMQWVGGLGVVIMVIGILIRPGTTAARLYKSEAREEKIKPSITGTVKTIWWIYLAYTIVGVVLYVLAGMPLFDAICNTFTSICTGGMAITNDSIGAYNNIFIYVITMILMILGGTSFLVHYKAIKGRITDVFRDVQFQAMIIIITVFSILLVFISKFAAIDSIYFVISALSSTGSNIQPISEIINWPDFAKVLILGLMIVGMSAGSTSGAVKLIRVVTLVKSTYWEIKKLLAPQNSVITRKISNRQVGDAEIREAGSYLFIYFFFIFISWLVLVQYGYGAFNALFEVAAAQGNTGFTMGITSPTMPDLAQIFLIFNMWIGRIEIVPALVLFKGLWDVLRR